ncbi:hypothetical protein AGMMS50268_17910 [Spirochaetia bacterium]|nr:hypothetical protein AGMMS50268_17910 [Spirochaetia bacterium]
MRKTRQSGYRPPLTMKTPVSILLLFLADAAFVCGQTAAAQAADMEQLLGAQKITWEQAAYFSLGAALETAPANPEEAFAFVRERGWLPKNARAEETACMDSVSLLLMRSFSMPGGLMYRIFHNARYAYRELKSRGFIQGRVYASGSVSGAAFLQLLSELLSYSGGAKAGAFAYTGTAIPWFAAPVGDKADIYLSAGISAELENEAWKPVPDVHRFEFIYNPNPVMRFEIGRVPFSENLSWVYAGLFDGLAARSTLGGGNLSAGAFYTGLLNKKTAYIVMSPEDRQAYYDRDVYFSSRRLVLGANWEKTSIFDTRNTLFLSALGQFDLNGKDTKIHSQYLEARFDIPLRSSFNIKAGGVVELMEQDRRSTAAFGFSLDLAWLPPSTWQDSLTLGGRFSSGKWNDSIGAFVPITAQAQGRVLRPELTGVAFLQGVYTARFHSAASADLFAAYFFRTDETSYSDPGRDISARSSLLGGELYGSLSWMPLSDVLVSGGGGVFLPQTGKYFKDDAGLKYRITLELVLSF